jgi:hypothetical protein
VEQPVCGDVSVGIGKMREHILERYMPLALSGYFTGGIELMGWGTRFYRFPHKGVSRWTVSLPNVDLLHDHAKPR